MRTLTAAPSICPVCTFPTKDNSRFHNICRRRRPFPTHCPDDRLLAALKADLLKKNYHSVGMDWHIAPDYLRAVCQRFHIPYIKDARGRKKG